ncbi:MAG: 50S ribosomal protein L17 [Calditrichaeota bacterium]|nr:50S ribosomal protein L17 [Calditrichota bacterium]
MRHRKTTVKLNRTPSHRRATLMNLTRALVEHKKIKTTLARAKATRSYAERLITFAKRDDVAARRQVVKKLRNRDAVKTLFHEIGPRFRDRNGGYTRIVKLENREGDEAPMAILELVGFGVEEPVKPTRRRRRRQAPKRPAGKPAAAKEKPAAEEMAAAGEAEQAEAEATEEPPADVEERAPETEETAAGGPPEPETEPQEPEPEAEKPAGEQKESGADSGEARGDEPSPGEKHEQDGDGDGDKQPKTD